MSTTKQRIGNVLSGVGSGATIGMSIPGAGPIGAAVGGALGGIAGAFMPVDEEANQYQPPEEDPAATALRADLIKALGLPQEQKLAAFKYIHDAYVKSGRVPIEQLTNTYAGRRMSGSSGFLEDNARLQSDIEGKAVLAQNQASNENDANKLNILGQVDKSRQGLLGLYNQKYALEAGLLANHNETQNQAISAGFSGVGSAAANTKDQLDPNSTTNIMKKYILGNTPKATTTPAPTSGVKPKVTPPPASDYAREDPAPSFPPRLNNVSGIGG